MLENENSEIIAVIPENTSDEDIRIMQIAPEAIEKIRNFVEDVNNGKLRQRAAVKEFEQILFKL